MKVLVAIDSFKGSVSSYEAGYAFKKGFEKVYPKSCTILPMADGGEGTIDSLKILENYVPKKISVENPFGKKIEANYLLSLRNKTAIIEMAQSTGLTLIDEKNPMEASSFGLGEQILDAITMGCVHLIIGIGGSATNDGGSGMLKALGIKLLDGTGKEIPNGIKGLGFLEHVDPSGSKLKGKNVQIQIASDVNNTLLGKDGATYVFGPQKGVPLDCLKWADTQMAHYASVIENTIGRTCCKMPGAGAAGGVGFALLSMLNGNIKSGAELIFDLTKTTEHIDKYTLLVTGEGRIDSQTACGKVPAFVGKLGKKVGIPVIAIAGMLEEGIDTLYDEGINACYSILPRLMPLEEAMKSETAAKNIEYLAKQIAGLLKGFTID